ncbi:type II toxin-antitoxin system RelE/ParE family toxin [Phenylobacterium sp.]|uniref:type II toxin-antitoxin system RelE/ParE family toxin n=1 Tax=Phenylobacterium sp. TaxID=1871053 RepID=UPI00273070D4|nr:type II toxin-antitoxin system RelE/ParE family toxin [Phenylobacterium sp.]MDP1873334.1 type II toxin-antitoxin system RelE/ParE family toxin [Phenylobacterium sp.]MDP3300036.1 type II toxin-antitoxin system RelE/ParE family toxin [Phenylobacterium sp.]
MIRRTIVFSPEAKDDLLALYDWIASEASPETAMAYIGRIERFIAGFETAAERGTRRDDIRPGLRMIGFERRVTIAFVVGEQVTILRVFYAGRDWEAESLPP